MNKKFGNILLMGGSSGIGLAAAEYFTENSEQLWCISRKPSPFGEWLKADLNNSSDIIELIEKMKNTKIDAFLYLGGTWEEGAFTDDYAFTNGSFTEIDRVINVNLSSFIKLVQELIPSFRLSDDPRCVAIGSTSGIENNASREVANSASKYGLRGAVHALRKELPEIAITMINPANVATDEVLEDIAEGRFDPQEPIPMKDIIKAIKFALSVSCPSIVSEITIHQR